MFEQEWGKMLEAKQAFETNRAHRRAELNEAIKRVENMKQVNDESEINSVESPNQKKLDEMLNKLNELLK